MAIHTQLKIAPYSYLLKLPLSVNGLIIPSWEKGIKESRKTLYHCPGLLSVGNFWTAVQEGGTSGEGGQFCWVEKLGMQVQGSPSKLEFMEQNTWRERDTEREFQKYG